MTDASATSANSSDGEVGDFQRDQLLTEFIPKDPTKQIIHTARQYSAKRCAVVDEVDGLMLDHANMVLYLSHNVESLRQFEPLFVHIWELVNTVDPARVHPGDDALVAGITRLLEQKIADGAIKFPGFDVPNAPYMQSRNMLERRLRTWVQSALFARTLRRDHEYVVVEGEKPAVVVMDKGTGVEQGSVRWSHGLHQFLQLKHGLEVAPESLKAVFLSNLFFFKQYKNQLFGLSGTLGSEMEQDCLSKLFDTEFFKVPRIFGEKYVHKADQVTGDATEWAEAIATEVGVQRDNGRATLVVCENIEDVLTLKKALKKDFPGLHTYTRAHESLPFLDPQTPQTVRPGDLIIATNLAGRGTDLKTSEELEQAGGLHVVLSYLPANIRVQQQAFGRTARHRNQGSGQFIICDSSRRPLHELCRERDTAERGRLEGVLQRAVFRIEMEHDLLRGFRFGGDALGGFAALQEEVRASAGAAGQPDYYVAAQLDSLKNRWAFWLDSMGEKLDLVHVTGRSAIVGAYRAFERGVRADMVAGWQGLVVEPAELIRLGGAYRRDKRWREAERCYEKAAEDPEYRVAIYYRAACRLMYSPTADPAGKKAFRRDAKVATAALEEKLRIFQDSAQTVSRLMACNRPAGNGTFTNLYSERVKDKVQIGHMLLSSIRGALGEAISAEALDHSNFVRGVKHGQEIISKVREGTYRVPYSGPGSTTIGLHEETRRGNFAKPTRVSRQFEVKDGAFVRKQKPLLGMDRFASVAAGLAEVLVPGQAVSPKALAEGMAGLMTRQRARADLESRATFVPHLHMDEEISVFWMGWADKNYESSTRTALAERYARARRGTRPDETLQALKNRFLRPELPGADGLSDGDCAEFFSLLESRRVVHADTLLDLTRTMGAQESSFASLEEARAEVARIFHDLDPVLVTALGQRLIERVAVTAAPPEAAAEIEPKITFRLTNKAYLSELSLPAHLDEATKVLWTALEQEKVIKPTKIKLPDNRDLKEQVGALKALLRRECDLDRTQIDAAVDSVFEIIETSLGTLRMLDDKKVTVEFAAISKKFFLDHAQDVPPALRDFVEAGLDVVASIVEMKEPPAWYEVTALAVMGVAQIVAGVLVKTFVPVAGEFIGNVLISTGIDDVIFGVTSAISGEFSWGDYWEAKQSSMLNAVKSAAIVSVASFASTSLKHGVGMAWDQQVMSQSEKLEKMAKVVDRGAQVSQGGAQAAQSATRTAAQVSRASFNISSHVAKEVGRAVVNAGLAQVASRGIGAFVQQIASSYAGDVEGHVREAVAAHWKDVAAEVRGLWGKVGAGATAQAKARNCRRQVIRQASQPAAFASLVSTSKPAIGIAARGVVNGGWGTVLASGGDLANLGFSIHRMVGLVENEVAALARSVRKAKDDAAEAESGAQSVPQDEFDAFLAKEKEEFSRGLVGAFNGLLSRSVISPLVSHATQLAAGGVTSSLLPTSEVENWASSSSHLAKLLGHQGDANTAWYDGLLRDFRGAGTEVDIESLPPEERVKVLRQVVGATGKTLAQLEADFRGRGLKVFCDAQSRLYVQRPDLGGYSRGSDGGAPAGLPDYVAMAAQTGRPISFRDRDTGLIKTFHANGRIDSSTPGNAIKLDYTAGAGGGLGHITVPGANESSVAKAGATTDCFYTAVIEKLGVPEGTTVASLRSQIAQRLVNDEACQLFYHNWSLEAEVKEFSGHWSTKTVGANATVIFGGGATVGFGWYTDRDTGEYGLYGSAAAGPGFSLGLGASAQMYKSLNHLRGKSLNFELGVGLVSYSYFKPLDNLSASLGHGLGPSISPNYKAFFFGASMTAGGTGTIALSNILTPVLAPVKQSLSVADEWARRSMKAAFRPVDRAFSDLDEWATRGVQEAYGLR